MIKNIFILIIIIIINIIVISYISEPVPSICKKIHIDEDNKNFKVIKMFDINTCNLLIKEANDFANKYGWTKDRHDNYPTTDNKITEEWNMYPLIEKIFISRIAGEFEQLFGVDKNLLSIDEFFFVKYDANDQPNLEYHKDGSDFSFVIALNDDFEGGGTTFKHNGQNIKLGIGECILFLGQNTHCGEYVRLGTRYIITGFISFKEEEYCAYHVDDYYFKYDCLLAFNLLIIIYLLITQRNNNNNNNNKN